mgnify:CR=1 FL=1
MSEAAAPRRRDARFVLSCIGIGLAAGLLSGLFGVGGGFLIIPALVVMLGVEMSTAIGTSLLIIVGVGLDTVKQIESQLQQRHYEGFLS